jgi:hypothetical protein
MKRLVQIKEKVRIMKRLSQRKRKIKSHKLKKLIVL